MGGTGRGVLQGFLGLAFFDTVSGNHVAANCGVHASSRGRIESPNFAAHIAFSFESRNIGPEFLSGLVLHRALWIGM